MRPGFEEATLHADVVDSKVGGGHRRLCRGKLFRSCVTSQPLQLLHVSFKSGVTPCCEAGSIMLLFRRESLKVDRCHARNGSLSPSLYLHTKYLYIYFSLTMLDLNTCSPFVRPLLRREFFTSPHSLFLILCCMASTYVRTPRLLPYLWSTAASVPTKLL